MGLSIPKDIIKIIKTILPQIDKREKENHDAGTQIEVPLYDDYYYAPEEKEKTSDIIDIQL